MRILLPIGAEYKQRPLHHGRVVCRILCGLPVRSQVDPADERGARLRGRPTSPCGNSTPSGGCATAREALREIGSRAGWAVVRGRQDGSGAAAGMLSRRCIGCGIAPCAYFFDGRVGQFLLPMDLVLNYISIRAAMRAAIDKGQLWPLNPTFDSDPVKRTILINQDIAVLLENPERRMQRLRADLETFVKGEEVTLSMVPYKHKTAYMGLLSPESEGIWEIRSRDPSPAIRVLGSFALTDVFVALAWRLRSRRDHRWPAQRPLGDRHSLEYQFTQISVLERWSAVFPEHKPITGSDPSELLSDKYNCV